MRIRITEEQAKKLALLKEDVNPLEKFEAFCSAKGKELDNMYLGLINLSVDDIINRGENVKEFNNKLSDIESAIRNGSRMADIYVNNLPESNLDIRVDNARSSVLHKIDLLELISKDLENLQQSFHENRFKEVFKDVKPYDISDIQK